MGFDMIRCNIRLTTDDEQAILESLCMDDEEDIQTRRGICREYIENKVADMIRSLRSNTIES